MKEIIKQISEINNVTAIYLFGSQINGNARKDSDTDIAVIAKPSEETDADILGFSNNEIDISLFHRLPLIIQFRILSKWKLVYCKDEKELHKIKVSTIRKYLDFQLFIERFYKQVIKNV